MNWTGFVVLGLFVVACLLALHRSRVDDWNADRKLGSALFLAGAATGLFLDDLLAANSPILPWIEPIGAVVMIVGLLVPWLRQLD